MMATYNSQAGALPPHQQFQNLQQPSGSASQQGPPVVRSHAGKGRPKSRSLSSFASNKSGGKAGSQKLDPETHDEKESRRLHSKADPTLAMNEAEPSLIATTEKVQLAPLRSIAHRDAFGNPITEPDLSNPTRSRWERPLDTIRSFEAAIDGSYSNRRTSVSGPGDNESVAGGQTRRNSYYNNNARYPQDSYYGGRLSNLPSSGSQYDLRRGDSHGEHVGYGNPNPNGSGLRPRNNRAGPGQQQQYNQGHPQYQQNIYPATGGQQRSYETVASGSGASGDPVGYQTDLTSDNSSVGRQSPQKYGNFQQPGYGKPAMQPTQAAPGAPAVPTHAAPKNTLLRKPTQGDDADSKRKSWFSRKLSRRS